MFAGMMFGAVGWGTCASLWIVCTHIGLTLLSIDSDLMGRIPAFNATLFLTALFGISASLATTFPMLCSALFFLGSALGVRLFFQPSCFIQILTPERVPCLQTALFY
jgi:hypothetical protein